MCEFLNISRSYYYKLVKLRNAIDAMDVTVDNHITQRVKSIYDASKMNYGSRKISAVLRKESIDISPYKTLNIMKELGLSSLYNRKWKFHPYEKNEVDKDELTSNLLGQSFDQSREKEVITSDVTYLPYNNKFVYVCFVIDLFNREIVAFGVSERHNADFIYDTLSQLNLKDCKMFHSDRGTEYVNKKVSDLLQDNGVIRSVSKAGCPYDNAVSENLFGIFKREWMSNNYNSIDDILKDVTEFVHNYNYFRVHSKLNYMSPVEYRLSY